MIEIRKICITFSFLMTFIIVSANDTIVINQNQYFIDYSKNMILSNLDVGFVNSSWSNTKTHIALDEVCAFLNPVATIEIGTEYTVFVPAQNSNLKLYFTELPIISISTNNTIVDDPMVLANFKMIETNQNFIKSHIGVQYRGGWYSNPETGRATKYCRHIWKQQIVTRRK
jgi:hypothetical protein